MYKQCRLVKGTTEQVAWIPMEFARKGIFVKLRDEDGWMVDWVYDLANDGEWLKPGERGYRGDFGSLAR